MSGILTASELESMRQTSAGSLPGLCTVKTKTLTRDAIGGGTAVWSSTTNVPCRLTALGTNKGAVQLGGATNYPGGWTLYLRYDQAIAAGNRVAYNGKTYEVTGVEDDNDDRAFRRALLRRID